MKEIRSTGAIAPVTPVSGRKLTPCRCIRQLRLFSISNWEAMKRSATLPGLGPDISALDLLHEGPLLLNVQSSCHEEKRLKKAAFALLAANGLYDKFYEYLHDKNTNKGETLGKRLEMFNSKIGK